MLHPSHKTDLSDRILWYDGDSTIAADKIVDAILQGMSPNNMYTDKLSADIEQYNKLVKPPDQVTIKQTIAPLDYTWNIPQEWEDLDIDSFIHTKFVQECELQGWDLNTQTNRINRICEELQIYDQLNLMNVLRTLIYVINTLEEKNVVWGIGRGSSVASYILYLIGVHDIDSIRYNLDITDFLRV